MGLSFGEERSLWGLDCKAFFYAWSSHCYWEEFTPSGHWELKELLQSIPTKSVLIFPLVLVDGKNFIEEVDTYLFLAPKVGFTQSCPGFFC